MTAPNSPTSLTGTVVRGVSFSGVGLLLARGLSLATYVVLARLIAPEELGHFAAGTILVGIGVMLSGSGMRAAIIHRKDRLEEAAATAVLATVTAGALSALLALASSPLLGTIFGSDTVSEVAAATAGVLVIRSGRTIPNALLQRRFSVLRRLVVEPVSAVAFGVGAIVATAEGLGVWGLVIGLYSSAVVDLAMSWALVGWRPKLALASIGMWRELVGYGRHVLAGTVTERVGGQIPIALVGSLLGASALGQYQYANRIVGTAFAFLQAGVSYTIFPAFARLADERARIEAAFLRSMQWVAILALPVGFVLLALGEPLTTLALGPTWSEAGAAAMALCLFIPGRALVAVVGERFKGSGMPSERTRVNVFLLLSSAAGMALLIPLGLVGVGLGISAGSVAGTAYSLHRAKRRLGISVADMITRIWPPLAASLAMLAALLPLEVAVVDAASHGTALGLLLLVAEALLGCAVYAGALRLLVPGIVRELLRLLRTARRGRRGSQPAPVGPEAEVPASM